MSIYFSGDNEILELVKKIMHANHPDLVKARVDIGVTFAISSKENQPALKEHGHPAFGYTKIVAPKDRIRKGIDIELWIDGDEWNTDRTEHREAKIDHLLMRVEVKKAKPKKKKRTATHGSDEEVEQHAEPEFVTDAGGKAVLKMRKPDLFVPGGFREVIERHGDFAPECIVLDRAKIVASVACEIANTLEKTDMVTAVTLISISDERARQNAFEANQEPT